MSNDTLEAMTSMPTAFSAPRVAEFPTIELEAGFPSRNMDKVPVQVASSWVADAYGDDEGSLAAELPLDLIFALYPDAMRGGVVRFDLIRDTPAMEQVQDLTDAVATAFIRGNRRLLKKLGNFQTNLYGNGAYLPVTQEITHWARKNSAYDSSILELYDDVNWLSFVATFADRESVRRGQTSRLQLAFHTLALFLITAQIGSENLKEEFARIAPQVDKLFKALGLRHMQGIYAMS